MPKCSPIRHWRNSGRSEFVGRPSSRWTPRPALSALLRGACCRCSPTILFAARSTRRLARLFDAIRDDGPDDLHRDPEPDATITEERTAPERAAGEGRRWLSGARCDGGAPRSRCGIDRKAPSRPRPPRDPSVSPVARRRSATRLASQGRRRQQKAAISNHHGRSDISRRRHWAARRQSRKLRSTRRLADRSPRLRSSAPCVPCRRRHSARCSSRRELVP